MTFSSLQTNENCKCFHSSFDQNIDSQRFGSISNQFDIEAPPFMMVDIPRINRPKINFFFFIALVFLSDKDPGKCSRSLFTTLPGHNSRFKLANALKYTFNKLGFDLTWQKNNCFSSGNVYMCSSFQQTLQTVINIFISTSNQFDIEALLSKGEQGQKESLGGRGLQNRVIILTLLTCSVHEHVLFILLPENILPLGRGGHFQAVGPDKYVNDHKSPSIIKLRYRNETKRFRTVPRSDIDSWKWVWVGGQVSKPFFSRCEIISDQ